MGSEDNESRLKHIIRDAGLTNQELAKKIGCQAVEIWRLAAWPDAGGRKMTPEWAIKIAPHVGITPQELVFGVDTTDSSLQIKILRRENEKLRKIIIDLIN